MRISDWSSDVCSSDLAIKGTDAELHKQMHPSGRPLHLLLLCEALCDDLVDGRFHEGGRDCFAISSSLAIVRDHAGIGADIAFELPQMLEEIARSEEHTSELQSLMRISYAVFCLKKKII